MFVLTIFFSSLFTVLRLLGDCALVLLTLFRPVLDGSESFKDSPPSDLSDSTFLEMKCRGARPRLSIKNQFR